MEVSADGYIDFLDKVKERDWEILHESGEPRVWKLHTPLSFKKIQEPGFLANIGHLKEIPEEEKGMNEEDEEVEEVEEDVGA